MKNIIKKILVPLLFAASLAPKANAQNEAKIVLTNSVVHGLIGGIGALQHEKNFFEGFGKGFAGGTFVGLGKYWVGENVNGAWGAKILTSIGTSVTYNTAQGKDAFAMIMMDLGPVMLTYDYEKGFKPYLLAMSTFDLIRTIAEGHKFDLEESLRRGTPIFQVKYKPMQHGFSRSNIIGVVKHDSRLTQVVRHELIHSYQYAQSFALEPVLRNVSFINHAMSFSEKYFIKLDYINYTQTQIENYFWKHDKRPLEIEAMSLAKPTKLKDIFK